MYVHVDVAEVVLNRCTDTSMDRNIRPDSKEYAVKFNYEFIEDEDRVSTLVAMIGI